MLKIIGRFIIEQKVDELIINTFTADDVNFINI
jgi:hypothetical protein